MGTVLRFKYTNRFNEKKNVSLLNQSTCMWTQVHNDVGIIPSTVFDPGVNVSFDRKLSGSNTKWP